MDQISVFLVTGHRLFTSALTKAIDDSGSHRVVGAGDVDGVIDAVERLDPDVVVVDADAIEGTADLVATLTDGEHAHRVLVIVGEGQASVASVLVRSGATGVAQKEAGLDELLDSIDGMALGETRIPQQLLTTIVRDLRHPAGPVSHDDEVLGRLTPREREVLECMATGHDRAAIADELYLSVNTVRTHIRQILSKAEVHSSLEAVALLLRSKDCQDGSGSHSVRNGHPGH